MNVDLNFVGMVYQENYSNQMNCMIIFDIDTNCFESVTDINPSQSNLKYIYSDD